MNRSLSPSRWPTLPDTSAQPTARPATTSPARNNDSAMRVLYIDHTSKIGGGEIALFNIVRYLDRTAVTPSVLLFEDGPFADKLRPVVDLHILPLDASVAHASKDGLGVSSGMKLGAVFQTLRHILKVTRFIRASGAEIVHTNSLKADIIGGIAGRLARVPVIWHVRDRIENDYLPARVVSVFRRLARTLPKFVIGNSAATLATVQLNGKRPSAVVGSGVDLSHQAFAAEPVQPPRAPGQSTATIGLVGRISPWKGQDIFLRAAAQVLQQHPATRFEIIGAALFAERDYEASLHALCQELSITHAVEFTGFLKNVPERVAQLDLLVHASTTGEPFGQVIIEGMAASKPVVATNGGGVPEIVEDGVTGILVPMKKVNAMAQAILRLLENPTLATQMGQRGRERVLAHFTIQRTCQQLEEIYRQLLV